MNSTSIKIKKFLSNRNTVTIICAILGIVVLFVGYSLRINAATNPKTIPYAKVAIQPHTLITDDMIGRIEVPSAASMGNIIEDESQIVGKYSNINTMIPEGSMFYEGAVVDKEDLPDSSVFDVKKGEILYEMKVNAQTDYINTIVPNGYVDIYVTTNESSSGQVRIGKFVGDVKVLDVYTQDGLRVYENTDEIRTPASVYFTLDQETHYYLKAAEELGLSITMIPTNVSNYDDLPISSTITSREIKEYIDSLSSEFIQDNVLNNNSTSNNNSTNTNTNTNTNKDNNTNKNNG